MTKQTEEALKMAVEAMFKAGMILAEALQDCKEALALSEKQHTFPDKKQSEQEVKCNPHPKAPHGFSRDASHSADRYVCDCEGWDAWQDGYEEGLRKGLELEQPAQESVLSYEQYEDLLYKYCKLKAATLSHPAPSWQGLSDDEIDVIDEANWDEDHKSWCIRSFARAIEQASKEKNNGTTLG